MSPASRFPLADGHADSLMWNRDLTQRSDRGHVDFPRLQEAGTRIQCFTMVTRIQREGDGGVHGRGAQLAEAGELRVVALEEPIHEAFGRVDADDQIRNARFHP